MYFIFELIDVIVEVSYLGHSIFSLHRQTQKMFIVVLEYFVLNIIDENLPPQNTVCILSGGKLFLAL